MASATAAALASKNKEMKMGRPKPIEPAHKKKPMKRQKAAKKVEKKREVVIMTSAAAAAAVASKNKGMKMGRPKPIEPAHKKNPVKR